MKGNSKGSAWRAYGGSLALHGLVVAVVALTVVSLRRPQPVGQRLAIEGTIVRSAPTPRRAEPPPTPEPAPVADPLEVQRKQAEQEKAEREKAEQQKVEQQKVEQERLLAQQAEEERQARERAQREKVEREKAEKAEKERQAREKAEREKAEREKAAEAARQKELEADLNARLAAEERQNSLRASGMMNQYVAQITAKIERNWNRPPTARSGLECEVRVTQVPGGVVTAARVGRCNGDAAVRDSIEAAVMRASPLPQPPDPALFERNLVVTFRPED